MQSGFLESSRMSVDIGSFFMEDFPFIFTNVVFDNGTYIRSGMINPEP